VDGFGAGHEGLDRLGACHDLLCPAAQRRRGLDELAQDGEGCALLELAPACPQHEAPERLATPQAAFKTALRPDPHGPSIAMHRLGTWTVRLKISSNSRRN